MADLSRLASTQYLRTVGDVVDHFLRNKQNLPQMDYDILRWVRSARGLEQAIMRACLSRDAHGKKYHHQGRVWDPNLRNLAHILTKHLPEIRRCRSFDDLYDVVDKHAPIGIGPVTKYDVAYRIGHYKRVYPTSVYVQAGVITGAKALGLSTKGRRSIPIDEFPKELRRLPASDIEDLL